MTKKRVYKDLNCLFQGSSTLGPPSCVIPPAATFDNKCITQDLHNYCGSYLPLVVNSTRAARELAHNKIGGSLPKRLETHGLFHSRD